MNIRVAHLILLEFTNHPVCAAKEQDLFIEAQPPLLENGGEWTRRPAAQSVGQFWPHNFISYLPIS